MTAGDPSYAEASIHPATGLLAAIVGALLFARSGFGGMLGRCRSNG
jgi:hypothetical protein